MLRRYAGRMVHYVGDRSSRRHYIRYALPRYYSTTIFNEKPKHEPVETVEVLPEENAEAETLLAEEQIDSDTSVSLEDMKKQLRDTEQRATDLHDRLLRALAEIENGRRRHEKALADCNQYAITKFSEAMLEVCDNLELALDHGKESSTNNAALIEGIEMTQAVLNKVLENFGVVPFDAYHQPFCPTRHEALFQIEAPDVPKGTVVQVVKKGYHIHDRILRPAKVAIAK